MTVYRDYGFRDASAPHTMAYLIPPILALSPVLSPGVRVLDVGCGNGYLANEFAKRGCAVVGIDLSESGIRVASQAYPTIRFVNMAADENVLRNLAEAPFDLVVSTEVVEHLYNPRAYVHGCYRALKPGGRFICSTPYHGYLKNLAIALAGKWDSHANPLWDGGHIKLWSQRTLGTLLEEAGFRNLQFRGAGRAPWLWMSMVMSADRSVGNPKAENG